MFFAFHIISKTSIILLLSTLVRNALLQLPVAAARHLIRRLFLCIQRDQWDCRLDIRPFWIYSFLQCERGSQSTMPRRDVEFPFQILKTSENFARLSPRGKPRKSLPKINNGVRIGTRENAIMLLNKNKADLK